MKSKIFKGLGLILVLLSLVFLAYSFKDMNLNELKELFSISWIPFTIIAILFYSIVNILLAINWSTYILILSNHSINPYPFGLHVYLKTSIAKYLPSNVMHFAGRHLLIDRFKLSHKILATSTLAEIGSLILASCFIVFTGVISKQITIPKVIFNYLNYKALIIIVILGLLIVIAAIIYILYSKKLNDLIALITKKNIGVLICTLLLYTLFFIITGLILAGIFFILFNQDFNLNRLILVLSAYTLSWLIGYVTPGASGGAGIREMALLLMLEPVFGNTMTLTAALILRVITVLGDFASFSYSFFIFKSKENLKSSHLK